ncbi:hypothetical protein F2Q69_00007768 [Brassica cretica]|uniref:Uncharacterized protein n=1 Tax=Brassica cretica TaxID=69181 RepID=A0A8S9PJL5_BRACR|nr:hypothetical protein F2Q69_00007768 [Brassica cretica]
MKSVSMRIQKRTQRRTFLRPDSSLCSEWRSDRSLRSEWKQAKKSPTCFRRKLRLRRNEKCFDEDSKENAKEDPF